MMMRFQAVDYKKELEENKYLKTDCRALTKSRYMIHSSQLPRVKG
jgi:hypothetical protein